MKKLTASIFSAVLMLSMVFSSSVFAANDATQASAWESFLGLFSKTTATATTANVQYRGHVQDYGDVPTNGTWVQEDNQLGTTGECKRIEGFKIELTDGNTLPAGTQIRYNVHVENEGWLHDKNDIVNTGSWEKDGAFAGSVAKSQRVEAIEIVLTDANGVKLEGYSVQYMVHGEDYGWSQGWVADGTIAGTEGQSKRLEAIRIKIVKTQANLDGYNTALSEVTQSDYTTASWTTYQAVVNANKVTADNTQTQVDTATANIKAAQLNLVLIPKVTSVTAVNLNTLKVDFNTAVDPISSVVPGNYKLASTALTSTTAPKIVLAADAKSVTITLNAATTLTNKTNYTVTTSVADAIKTTGNIAIKEAATLVYVNDTTKPVATLVGYNKAAATFTLTFDEMIQNSGGNSLTGATVTVTKADGTVVATPGYTTTGLNFVLDTSGLTNDTTYNVSIVGARDLAGNYFEGNKLAYTFTTSATETVKPTIVSAEAVDATTIKVTFSEKLGAVGTIKAGAAVATNLNVVTTLASNYDCTVDTTGLIYTIKVPTMTTNTITPYEFAAQADLSNNVITTVTKSISYIKGTTAAKVASVSTLGQVVTVTFDKNVTVDSSGSTDITVVSPSSVQTVVADSNVTNVNTTVYPTKVAINLSSLTYENGVYKITLPSGLIKDAENNTTAYEISATIGGGDTIAPTVKTGGDAPSVTLNKLTVKYSELMGASAIEPSNYTVDGVQVFESAYFDTTKDVVVLTVKDGSFDSTATRELKIQNVADVAGNVIAEPYTLPLSFEDNTQPTIVSAVLGTDYKTITVTYTKDLDALSVDETTDVLDYKVLVGGTEVALDGTTPEAVTNNVVTLTLATALNATQYNQAITIAPTTNFDVTYNSGMKITNFTSYTVTK